MMSAAAHIFAFDALIANDDRRTDNPIVLVRGDELFVIDHEAAFSFLYFVAGKNPAWQVRDRASLRRHVFFYQLRKREAELSLFTARLAALGDEELERIVREVPQGWRHGDIGRISADLQVVYIGHRLLSLDVMVGADIPNGSLCATHQNEKQPLRDGRFRQVLSARSCLRFPTGQSTTGLPSAFAYPRMRRLKRPAMRIRWSLSSVSSDR